MDGDFHFSIALFYLNVTITCNLHAHIQHQGLSNMSVAGNPSVADDPSGATGCTTHGINPKLVILLV